MLRRGWCRRARRSPRPGWRRRCCGSAARRRTSARPVITLRAVGGGGRLAGNSRIAATRVTIMPIWVATIHCFLRPKRFRCRLSTKRAHHPLPCPWQHDGGGESADGGSGHAHALELERDRGAGESLGQPLSHVENEEAEQAADAGSEEIGDGWHEIPVIQDGPAYR